IELGIETSSADVVMNGVAQRTPPLKWRLEAERLGALDAAVEGDPGHYRRRNIVPACAAALPDAMIGLVPYFGKMLEYRAFYCPGASIQFELGGSPLMECVDQFAVDVELQLRMRGIADPHWLRAFVAGQPFGLPFQQAALPHDAVHDLHVGGRARRCPQAPLGPGGGFLGVARIYQRQQREGGVAQPAEAIVPVACAAELFWQRCGWRGDD